MFDVIVDFTPNHDHDQRRGTIDVVEVVDNDAFATCNDFDRARSNDRGVR